MEVAVVRSVHSLRQLLWHRLTTTHINGVTLKRPCSSSVNRYNDVDPAPVFFDKNVQEILKRVTGCNFNAVFRRRYDEKPLSPPKYEFLTEEELQKRMEEAKGVVEKILQMPPVLKERQPITGILSRDPALTGFDTCKYIFTDITFGVSDRKRNIVVRDMDGTLRHASWEERDRMNQIYNPRPGRKLKQPKIFLEENLQGVLQRENYEFVLDRVCAQFEPDDPEYHRVCSMVYEAIEGKRHYQMLHSTRHYGPMCFYLVWHRKMDNLLISLIQQENLSSCADIVQLHQLIHTSSKSIALNVDPKQHLDFVKAYVDYDSLQRPQLQLAIQAYQDIIQERQQYQEEIKTAHGL